MNAAHFSSLSHIAQHCSSVTPQRSLFECVFTTDGPTTLVSFCNAEQVEWRLPGGGGGGGGGGGDGDGVVVVMAEASWLA